QILAQSHDIERHGLLELQNQFSVGCRIVGRPVKVSLFVEDVSCGEVCVVAADIGSCRLSGGSEVVSEYGVQFVAEFGQRTHIVLVDSAAPVRGKVEQKRSSMPN